MKCARPLLVLSSLGFGAFALGVRSKVHRLGMALVCVTSIVYHWTDYDLAKCIDIVCNFVMAIGFSVAGAMSANIIMCVWAMVTLIGYLTFKNKKTNLSLTHLCTVHFPVMMGFTTLL